MAEQGLQISSQLTPQGIPIVSLRGRLDSKTALALDAIVQDALTANHCEFVLDLTDLTYVSSAGCGVLVWSRFETSERNGGVVLLSTT